MFSEHARIIRKLGFSIDQQGIMNRYLREQDGWNGHLQNSREFILQKAQKTDNNLAIILGSGWCLDVPLQELSMIFKEVWLIDIVHPPQIKHKVKKLKNVRLITADITGGAAKEIYHKIKDRKKIPLRNLTFNSLTFGITEYYEPDLLVSLNILNQLDIIITDYLMKLNRYTQDELLELKIRIQQQHLEALPPNKSCLITDYEEIHTDKDGTPIGTKTLLYVKLPQGQDRKLWQWKFDSHATYHHNCNTLLNVIALSL